MSKTSNSLEGCALNLLSHMLWKRRNSRFFRATITCTTLDLSKCTCSIYCKSGTKSHCFV